MSSSVFKIILTKNYNKVNFNSIFKTSFILFILLMCSTQAKSQVMVQLINQGNSSFKGHYLNVGQSGNALTTNRNTASGTFWVLQQGQNGKYQLVNQGNSPYKGFYLNVGQDGNVLTTNSNTASGTFWTVQFR